jgi:small nuclear ribonucleoprotein (snRNP)-like protein
MPQLRVYRSFIKKAADTGKYLIIWDDQRRYEGVFKGFDPQGEFVILSDVTIIDKQEELHAPETLIPIENIKIVSTETEEQRKRRLESKVEVAVGTLMPGKTIEEAERIEVKKPEKIEEPKEITEFIPEPEPKPREIVEEEKPVVEEAFSEEEQKPAEAEAQEALKPEAQEPASKPETREEGDFVSVIESEVDTSLLSPETRELLKEISEKAAAVEKKEEPVEVPKKDFEETAPAIEPVKPAEPEISIIEDKKTEVPGLKEEPQKVEKVEPAKTAVTPATKAEEPKGKTPKVIAEKSEKAARSKFFAKAETKKPELPKRKVDIGTIILDIIIVILGIVAIGLLVVTVLGIRLPF